MTIFKKKATDIQETKKLPMTGKVKKRLPCLLHNGHCRCVGTWNDNDCICSE